jgi:pyruvate,water dikinase
MTDVLWFSDLALSDLDQVGGKNASLGEMVRNLASAGVKVPDGFATTADAYRRFLGASGLDTRIEGILEGLDSGDVAALALAGKQIRDLIISTPFPSGFEEQIRTAYNRLTDNHGGDVSWAVRSSATAEDLPDASFAGQQETFLNIRGVDNILLAIKDVFASLYNDRAIAYRVHHGFTHSEVALSAGVQRMVRSDVGASGVMFTMDTETGFNDAVFITSSYGLGEAVVQGAVNPDEFYVHKPALAAGRPAVLKRGLGEKAVQMTYTESREVGRTVDFVPVPQDLRRRFSLTDEEVEQLARHAVAIEAHYGRPMDIEWGKDGVDGELYILQARPEPLSPAKLPAPSPGTRSRNAPLSLPRAGPSASGSVPARCGCLPRSTRWPRSRPETSWWPT